MPEEWPYEEVGRLFEDPEIKWSPPAEEGLLNFLVSKNGFNHDKVTKVVHKEVVHKATISRKLVLAFMGSAFKNKGIPADRAYISPLALAIASPSNHLHCSSFPTIRI